MGVLARHSWVLTETARKWCSNRGRNEMVVANPNTELSTLREQVEAKKRRNDHQKHCVLTTSTYHDIVTKAMQSRCSSWRDGKTVFISLQSTKALCRSKDGNTTAASKSETIWIRWAFWSHDRFWSLHHGLAILRIWLQASRADFYSVLTIYRKKRPRSLLPTTPSYSINMALTLRRLYSLVAAPLLPVVRSKAIISGGAAVFIIASWSLVHHLCRAAGGANYLQVLLIPRNPGLGLARKRSPIEYVFHH